MVKDDIEMARKEHELRIEIMRADIECKRQHAFYLQARARRENAEAVRIKKC